MSFPLSRGILFEHQEGFEPPSLRFAGVCLKPLDHWCIYLELMEGIEPTYPRYKGGVMTVIRHQHFCWNRWTRTIDLLGISEML